MGLPRYWVNASTLMLVVEDTDFAYSGLGPALSFKRTYNSTPSVGGMFGNGWSFAYDWDITNTCKGARLSRGSGRLHFYKTTSLCPEEYVVPPVETMPPDGVYDSLTLQTGNYWELVSQKKDRTRRFDYNSTTKKYHLTSITDQNGNVLTIARDANGKIQTVTDAAGRVTTFTLDVLGRCTQMTFPDGLTTSFTYDAKGNLLTSTDRLGTVTTYAYDADNYMTSLAVGDKTTVFAYTGDTKLIQSVQDALGGTITYGKDESTGEVAVTGPTGTQSEYTHKGAYLTNARDPSGANAFRFAYTGGRPVQSTDALDQVTTMSYDGSGNMTQRTEPPGYSTEYAYNAANRLTSYTNQESESWTFQYDANNNLTRSTSPGGAVTEYTYLPNGLISTRKDANNGTTTYTYDAFGNVASITDPLGNQTNFSYDASGINMASQTDARGNTRSFQYDALRRLTRITHPDGTFMTNAYDSCAMTSRTDEKGAVTAFQRDKLLRPVTVTDGTGAKTSYTYDGNDHVTDVTDPNGRRTSVTYDSAGKPVRQTNPLGDAVNRNYDANWNMTGFTDERENAYQFVYDANNRVSIITDPLLKAVSFERDPVGRVTQTTNGRGQTINRTYDADGRMTQKSYGSTWAADFTYDMLGNLIQYRDAIGEATWTRDPVGRVTAVAYPVGGTATRTYDAVGNTLTMTYPGGLTATSVYDSQDRATSISWSGGQVTNIYDAAGNLLRETRSNGTVTDYTYDSNGRVLSMLHKRGTQVIADLRYTRDLAGNVTGESGTQVLPVKMTAATATATYNAANQMTSLSGDTYIYDDDGNLASISGGRAWTLASDPENRPTTVKRSGTTATYTYDALGRRARSVTGSVTRNYHYDEKDRLLYETNGSGNLVVAYLYHGKRLIAMRTAGGAVYYYHYDATGNTVALTDSSGATVRAYRYGPFGEIVNQSGRVYNPFTYVGAWGVMDEGNGLFLMRHRYYDAVAGRFLQKDPIGFEGGSNLYAYVGNNPVNRIDPSGMYDFSGSLDTNPDYGEPIFLNVVCRAKYGRDFDEASDSPKTIAIMLLDELKKRVDEEKEMEGNFSWGGYLEGLYEDVADAVEDPVGYVYPPEDPFEDLY